MGYSSILCPVILLKHSKLYVFLELLSAGKPSFDPIHKILNLSAFQIADCRYYYSNKQVHTMHAGTLMVLAVRYIQ